MHMQDRQAHTPMSHIFISYSKQNKDYARKLADKLREEGFDVWIDKDRINSGANWERSIFNGIDQSAAFVVVMTPQAHASDWVLRECQYAEKRGKPTFPLLLEGEEFPRYIHLQYRDVRDDSLPPKDFYDLLAQHAMRQPDVGKDVTIYANFIPSQEVVHSPTVTLNSPDYMITEVTDEYFESLSSHFLPPNVFAILPPPFEWCEVPAGKVTIAYSKTDRKIFDIQRFWMAKYPITNAQYRVFIESDDGYNSLGWWKYSEEAYAWRSENFPPQRTVFPGNDLPRTNITWYEAVAFCQWMAFKLGLRVPTVGELVTQSMMSKYNKIALPTEQQWQRAAQGDDGRLYPWRNEFNLSRYNAPENWERDRSQPVSVSEFISGASPYGLMGMVGNTWEWCSTNWESSDADLSGGTLRVIRGCAHYAGHERAQVTFRTAEPPQFRNHGSGFRIICIPGFST
jgi:formylglycine-generating enzyme required for sulfatase activity